MMNRAGRARYRRDGGTPATRAPGAPVPASVVAPAALLTLVFVVLGLATPGAADAQVPWDSPQLVAPGSPGGVGLFVADWGLADDGVGALLTWRGGPAPGSVGLRAGVASGFEDDVIVVGGIDYSLPVLREAEAFPLEVIWVAGLGASWSDYLQLAVPVGLAMGRPVESGTLWLNPYLSTRLAFEYLIGSQRPDRDFRVGLAVDAGADVSIDRGRDFVLRLGASLGDRPALIAGLHLRL